MSSTGRFKEFPSGADPTLENVLVAHSKYGNNSSRVPPRVKNQIGVRIKEVNMKQTNFSFYEEAPPYRS